MLRRYTYLVVILAGFCRADSFWSDTNLWVETNMLARYMITNVWQTDTMMIYTQQSTGTKIPAVDVYGRLINSWGGTNRAITNTWPRQVAVFYPAQSGSTNIQFQSTFTSTFYDEGSLQTVTTYRTALQIKHQITNFWSSVADARAAAIFREEQRRRNYYKPTSGTNVALITLPLEFSDRIDLWQQGSYRVAQAGTTTLKRIKLRLKELIPQHICQTQELSTALNAGNYEWTNVLWNIPSFLDYNGAPTNFFEHEPAGSITSWPYMIGGDTNQNETGYTSADYGYSMCHKMLTNLYLVAGPNPVIITDTIYRVLSNPASSTTNAATFLAWSDLTDMSYLDSYEIKTGTSYNVTFGVTPSKTKTKAWFTTVNSAHFSAGYTSPAWSAVATNVQLWGLVSTYNGDSIFSPRGYADFDGLGDWDTQGWRLLTNVPAWDQISYQSPSNNSVASANTNDLGWKLEFRTILDLRP